MKDTLIPAPQEWRDKLNEYNSPAINTYSLLVHFCNYVWQAGHDPFLQLPMIIYGANTLEIEKTLIENLRKYLHGENWWGYAANYEFEPYRSALLTAREKHPKGIVYYSPLASRTIPTLAYELGLECREIATKIDKEKPAILMLGHMTTEQINTIEAAFNDQQHYTHRDISLDDAINLDQMPVDSVTVTFDGLKQSVFLTKESMKQKKDASYSAIKTTDPYMPCSSRSGLAAIIIMDKLVQTKTISSPEEWKKLTHELLERAKITAPTMLGYPANTEIAKNRAPEYLATIANLLLQTDLSNQQKKNTAKLRQQTLELAQSIYLAKNFSGFIGNGGYDANRTALLAAREKHPNGTVYFSKASHFCIFNLADELGMQRHEPINTDDSGKIDIDALMAAIDPNTPAIIVLTLGTTMTGAIDDSVSIKKRLEQENIAEVWIHCDAALHGNHLPFMAQNEFSQSLSICDSFIVDPYKFLGSSIYNSVCFIKEQNCPQYLATRQQTLYPDYAQTLLCLSLINEVVRIDGIEGMRKEVERITKLKQHAMDQLQETNIEITTEENSPIIIINNFPTAASFQENPALFPIVKNIIEKWQLKWEGGPQAGIVVSRHFTKKLLNEFVDELKNQLPSVIKVQPIYPSQT